MTSHTPEEWEKEFLGKFGYAENGNAYFADYLTENPIISFIRETRLASFNEGVNKALEVLPEEYDMESELLPVDEMRRLAHYNGAVQESREAIQALITNQD